MEPTGGARSGIERAVLRAYDAANHRATVELWGAAGYTLDVSVAWGVEAWQCVVGAQCAVLLFDRSDAEDGCLVAVYGGTLAPPATSPTIARAAVENAFTLTGQANTWGDVTGASVTVTPAKASGALVLFSAIVRHSTTGKLVTLRLLLDDVQMNPPGVLEQAYIAAGGTRELLCWSGWVTGLSAAAHTVHVEAQSDSMTTAYVDRLELVAVVYEE